MQVKVKEFETLVEFYNKYKNNIDVNNPDEVKLYYDVQKVIDNVITKYQHQNTITANRMKGYRKNNPKYFRSKAAREQYLASLISG